MGTASRDDLLKELVAEGFPAGRVRAAMSHLETEYGKVAAILHNPYGQPGELFNNLRDSDAPIIVHMLRFILHATHGAGFTEILAGAADAIVRDPRSKNLSTYLSFSWLVNLSGLASTLSDAMRDFTFRAFSEGRNIREKVENEAVRQMEADVCMEASYKAMEGFTGLPIHALCMRLMPGDPIVAEAIIHSLCAELYCGFDDDSNPESGPPELTNENMVSLLRNVIKNWKQTDGVIRAEPSFCQGLKEDCEIVLGLLMIASERHRFDAGISAGLEMLRQEVLETLAELREKLRPDRKEFPEKPTALAVPGKKKRPVS